METGTLFGFLFFCGRKCGNEYNPGVQTKVRTKKTANNLQGEAEE